MTVWFTADLHFGHTNIMRYSRRPFTTVEEMDEALVQRWAARVSPQDTVYVLGDVSFYKADKTRELVARLPGQKFLILGNHDRDESTLKKLFGWMKDLYTLKVPDPDAKEGVQRIVLCHYAMRTWNRSHHGSWHLYGHSHGSLPDDACLCSFDVGVDASSFAPVSYEEVKVRMTTKKFRPVDHHGAEAEEE